MTFQSLIATAKANHESVSPRNVSSLNMKPAQKERRDKDSQPSASENAPDTTTTTGMESEEVEQDHGKEELLELSTSDVNPTFSEVTAPVIDSGCTEESEVPPTTDPNDSLGDISEDFCVFGKSETTETEKEVMSVESQSCASESVPCKDESRSAENVSSRSADEGIEVPCDESKNSNSKEETVSKGEKQDVSEISTKKKNSISKEETASKRENQEDVGEISAKESKKRDQCCQATCVPDNARSDEVKILKNKLAISKKDTETMQKLLEDVRKDYEELQKSFEKRESEINSKAFVEELIKENEEMKKERAELKRKTSRKEGRVSSASEESRSSERRKTAKDKSSLNGSGRGESCEMNCSCFVQSIRKVITDVTEDFKDMISLIKQSSAEQRESVEKELATLKDEHRCAMERKDSEIRVFEEIIKGLESRIRESEREVVGFRDAVSSAYEEKHKLYDDIRGLKDDLTKAQHDSKTSREDLERIKYGLKKFCTAEEYEELEHLNFKFSESREVEEPLVQQGEGNSDVTEVRNKVSKFYPVLKKAKKNITKLKEEKQEVENRLQAKISQAAEKEKYLNKKLNKALSELKQSKSELTELTKQLDAQTLQNTKLNASVEELERRTEDLRGKHDQELRTVKDKLKISNDRLRVCQEKNRELQEDYETLRAGYNELKTFLDDSNAKKMKEVLDDTSDNDDSPEQLLKVRYKLRSIQH